MREVCLINCGENRRKAGYITGLSFDMMQGDDQIVNGMRSVVVKSGEEAVTIVRNYRPLFAFDTQKIALMDIYAMGYIIDGSEDDRWVVASRQEGIKYIVHPLEQLTDIAKKFDVTEQYIIDTNNLKTNKLFVGQVLFI